MITAAQLVDRVQALISTKPEIAGWPVHLLVMDDDGDNLCTTVEGDCFDDEQGMVLSLVSDRRGR